MAVREYLVAVRRAGVVGQRAPPGSHNLTGRIELHLLDRVKVIPRVDVLLALTRGAIYRHVS
eukprot:scaffold76841_cov69-Phaeocystis_antarctica.AAC.11